MKSKVLIVDDDQAIRDELASALAQDAAIEISLADDGQAALNQIATGKFWPDAMLLDLMMPGIDGDSFLAALAAINRTSDIAVIAMTALPPAAVPPGVRRRARSVLFKPFTVEQIVEALDDALRDRTPSPRTR